MTQTNRSLESLISERDNLKILIMRRVFRPTKAVVARLDKLNRMIEQRALAEAEAEHAAD